MVSYKMAGMGSWFIIWVRALKPRRGKGMFRISTDPGNVFYHLNKAPE